MAEEKVELSLHDEIGAALDAADQDIGQGIGEIAAGAEATDGRARDEHGRFAPKEAAPAVEQTGQQPITPSADPAQTVSVPASWPKEDAAVFATLPPEVQATIARREQEREGAFTRAMQNISEVERFHAALKPALDEHRGLIEATGLPPEQMITNVLRLADWAQRDPRAYVRWIVETYGIDPGEIKPSGHDEYADPAIIELRQGYQRLNETVQQFQNRIRQEEEAKVRAEADHIRDTINQWAGQKNPDGTVKWPHFADRNVQVHMGKLMEIDEQLTLDTAYERATRALGLAAPAPAAPQRKPVPNLTSRGAGSGGNASPSNLRDTIAEALDAVRA